NIDPGQDFLPITSSSTAKASPASSLNTKQCICGGFPETIADFFARRADTFPGASVLKCPFRAPFAAITAARARCSRVVCFQHLHLQIPGTGLWSALLTPFF